MNLLSPLQTLAMIRSRKQSYQLVANQPAGQAVLADLAKFCFAYETTFDADARVDARKQGRRDVWLRIQSHLKLTDDELYTIATGGRVAPKLDGETNGRSDDNPWDRD